MLANILNLRPRGKRVTAFRLLEEAEKKQTTIPPETIDNSNTWKDLDLFCGTSEPQKFVANALDRTVTEIGKISFYELLAQPTTDIPLLKQRQAIISHLATNDDLLNTFDTALQSFKDSENVTLLFWDRDPFKSSADRSSFFPQFCKKFNNSEPLLLAKSTYNNCEHLWYLGMGAFATIVLATYGILVATKDYDAPEKLQGWANEQKGQAGPLGYPVWKLADLLKNRWLHAAVALTTAVWCGINIYRNIDWVYGHLLFEKALHTIMIQISKMSQSVKTIAQTIKANDQLAQFEEFQPIIDFFEKEIPESKLLEKLVTLLQKDTFKGESSFFSNKGNVLCAYGLLHKLKEKFEKALAAVARLDAYLSVAKLVKEFEDKNVTFSFPQYVQAEKPFLKLTDFWHPLIDSDRAITNSLILGTANQRPNLVITGPNEGGKSTTLKSITLSLLMAQTLGVAPVRAMTFTPFNSIATYLNITDDIGVGNSLFKAEVLRVQQLIDHVENAQDGEFSFAVFDEIFNGTTPKEGSAAAYSVAKHLSQFPNSMCIIATHFDLLTQLENETDTFSNYQVPVICHENGKIQYLHKLERGISDQHVALNILRNQGFDSTIITGAQKIVNPVVTF